LPRPPVLFAGRKPVLRVLGAVLPLGVPLGVAPALASSICGKLFVVNAVGNSTLFATLPLPSGFYEPGLRQFAWAPADFGSYGGDLFVSIAAQNGGGGTIGEIDHFPPAFPVQLYGCDRL
jgi:hypothetical protein